MYSPSYYREDRDELILGLIEQNSFATLMTSGSSEMISHLPFVLTKSASGEIELLSHMARANPHWRELEKVGKGKAIFLGPHGYISPAWYSPSPDNVPTWNYAAVHANGVFEIINDRGAAVEVMEKLIGTFEDRYQTGWRLPGDEPAIDALMNHIVVFKFTQIQFEAKFKLSQKQGSENRESVIRQLKELNTESSKSLAECMKLASKI
jgi:transcriptional regulator